MEYSAFSTVFTNIFQKNGLQRFCDEKTIRCFYDFTVLLEEVNAHTNLTAIRTTEDAILKHYADCLLAEPYFPQGATVLDVGCGGGFPTIPLAIVRPDLKITALDSTQKKINFVEQAAKKLALTNVFSICARAEEEKMRIKREKFDVVTSRAVANLRVLAEITLPYAKTGGYLIALKGSRGKEELQDAANAVQTLGGQLEDDVSLLLHGAEDESRHILVIQKAASAPAVYPRQYAQILKKPL